MPPARHQLPKDHPYRRQSPTVRPVRFEPAAPAGGLPRILVVILAALVVWITAIFLHEHRLRQAIGALPAAMQEAAYRRAYDELATTCSTQPALDAHCREEAELIVQLPQCTDDCRALTRRFARPATK